MFKTHRTYNLQTGIKGSSIAVLNHGNGDLDVLYHQTIVVQKRGARIVIRNGGYDTISTRHVINTALRGLGVDAVLTRNKKQTVIQIGKYPAAPFDGSLELPKTFS